MSASLHSIAVISSFLNSPSLATICRPVQAPKHYIVTFFKAALVSCRPIRHPVLVFSSNAKSIATQTPPVPLDPDTADYPACRFVSLEIAGWVLRLLRAKALNLKPYGRA